MQHTTYNIYDLNGNAVIEDMLPGDIQELLGIPSGKLAVMAERGHKYGRRYTATVCKQSTYTGKENFDVYDTELEKYVLKNSPRLTVANRFQLNPRSLTRYADDHIMHDKRYYFYRVDNDGDTLIPEWFMALYQDIIESAKYLLWKRGNNEQI